MRTFVSDGAGVGRAAPLHPLGRRDARGFTPSRALPGAGLAGNWFSAGSGSCSGGNFVSDGTGASVLAGVCFRRRGRGALCFPTPLSRSPGAVLLRNCFPTKQAVLLRTFVSDGAGVGRSAPLHPLGRRGARGFTPSRALPGAGLAGNWFSAGAGSCSGGDFVFDGWSGRVCSGRSLVFDGARRGALCSPTPPRGRGARGLRPSRALPGAGLAGNWFSAGAGSCSGGNFVSDGVGASVLVGVWFSTARGVGRSAPLQPLGRRVREGCDPLALSREG